MPTIAQLPPSNTVSSADEIPVSQGGATRAVTVGALLASTQPAIIVESPGLIGRTSLGPGGPEQVGLGTGLNLAAGTLVATGLDHASFPVATTLSVNADLVISDQGSPMLIQASLLRELFTAGQNVAIDQNGVISVTAIAAGGNAGVTAGSVSGLPVVASLGSQDLVAVNHAGSSCAIAYSNFLQGLTIDQGPPAGPVGDTDTIWAAQGTNVMVAQNFGAVWGWIQSKLLSNTRPALEIQSNTTLDSGLHNGRLLICSQPVTLLPAPAQLTNGFQCTIINASSGNVALGAGVVSSNGNSVLTPWQSASLCCVSYSRGTIVFATISNSGAGPSVPGQVTGVATAGVTSTTVTLTWQAPPTGSAITSYIVQYRVSGTVSWNTLISAGSSTTYQLTNLGPGSSYDILVQAENATGPGAASAIVTAVTSSVAQVAAPPQVSGVSLSLISSNSVQLTWQGQSGVNAATSYTVQYRVTGSSTWVTSSAGNSGATASVSKLQPVTSYDFSIFGVNSAGSGPTSAALSTTTLALSQPVTTISWNLSPNGTYSRSLGTIGVNAHVTPAASPIQFGFSLSPSTPPTSWTAANPVNTDLWGAYVPTPATAGTWYAWAEGLDGSASAVSSSPFLVQ